jgi:hypothetical protein
VFCVPNLPREDPRHVRACPHRLAFRLCMGPEPQCRRESTLRAGRESGAGSILELNRAAIALPSQRALSACGSRAFASVLCFTSVAPPKKALVVQKNASRVQEMQVVVQRNASRAQKMQVVVQKKQVVPKRCKSLSQRNASAPWLIHGSVVGQCTDGNENCNAKATSSQSGHEHIGVPGKRRYPSVPYDSNILIRDEQFRCVGPYHPICQSVRLDISVRDSHRLRRRCRGLAKSGQPLQHVDHGVKLVLRRLSFRRSQQRPDFHVQCALGERGSDDRRVFHCSQQWCCQLNRLCANRRNVLDLVLAVATGSPFWLYVG